MESVQTVTNIITVATKDELCHSGTIQKYTELHYDRVEGRLLTRHSAVVRMCCQQTPASDHVQAATPHNSHALQIHSLIHTLPIKL